MDWFDYEICIFLRFKTINFYITSIYNIRLGTHPGINLGEIIVLKENPPESLPVLDWFVAR